MMQFRRLIAIVALASYLLTGGLIGSASYVLCLGVDGHVAIEQFGGACCPARPAAAPEGDCCDGRDHAAGMSGTNSGCGPCVDIPLVGNSAPRSTPPSSLPAAGPTGLLIDAPAATAAGAFASDAAISAIDRPSAGAARALYISATVLRC